MFLERLFPSELGDPTARWIGVDASLNCTSWSRAAAPRSGCTVHAPKSDPGFDCPVPVPAASQTFGASNAASFGIALGPTSGPEDFQELAPMLA